MKKLALALIGLTLVGSSAFAQTTGVLSRNAVGYVRIDAVRSNLHFIANNFFELNGAPITVTNLLGAQVPVGSQVLVWDPSAQQYRPESRTVVGWSPGTNRLIPGRGFWLRIPGNAVSNSYPVFLMGEVPDKTTAPTSTQSIAVGLNMVGMSYPVSTKWTNTSLAKSAPIGAQVLFWGSNGQYVPASRTVVGWSPNTNVINPGQGFWYRSSVVTNWTETKPYTWP